MASKIITVSVRADLEERFRKIAPATTGGRRATWGGPWPPRWLRGPN